MYYPLKPDNMDSIVSHYAREGFVVLTEVEDAFTDEFTNIVAHKGSLTSQEKDLLGKSGKIDLSPEQIQALKRIDVTSELSNLCLDVIGDILLKLLGPIIHTSRDFHFQFKKDNERREILKGYSEDGVEIQALYGIHNEFTAARILVSPSGLVCWVPLNTYEGCALNLFPGTHRRGLLTNRWLSKNEIGRADMGAPVKYYPRRGEIVLFHFMTMHGSGTSHGQNPVDGIRASCDIRFFPFCGIIDSEPTCLVANPIEWIRERIDQGMDEVLLAPLNETLAFYGERIKSENTRQHSVLSWAEFIRHWLAGNEQEALEAIARLVNTQQGFDTLESYQKRFTQIQLYERPFSTLGIPVPRQDLVK